MFLLAFVNQFQILLVMAVRFKLHQNHINPDFADALERNKHILAAFENTKAALARHNKTHNLAAVTRKNDVRDTPQTFAVDYVYDLLAAKFTKRQLVTHTHIYASFGGFCLLRIHWE